MFGDCGLRIPFPRRRARAAADPEPELDPVLLVSGIGGSILNARNKKSGFLTRVWVRVFLANLEFKKKVWSLYNPDTGYTESIDPNVEIVVPDDDYGLYAIDILDPARWVKCLRVSDLYHFHDMIDMLIRCGYKKGTTLFGYGYDFRQSNRCSNCYKMPNDSRIAHDMLWTELTKQWMVSKRNLKLLTRLLEGKKVNIISHSMGGLLVRCFITLHQKVFAQYVNKWICIACPFQGAPGCINDSLLTGLQFVYGFESFFFVSRWTMHQLLVECPSIYEMLPNPEFKWKILPVIKVWRKQSDKDVDSSVKLDVYDSIHCIALFEEALRNNEMTYNGKPVALPFNFSILKWASETRRTLNEAQLPSSVGFFNIYGISLDSPYDVCYGSEHSPIGDLSEVCHTVPEYTYVDGDGTVPAESAKADGLPAVARVGVKASHRGLLRDKQVFQLLKQWLGVTEKSTQSKLTSKVVDDFLHPDHQFGLQQNTKNIDSV